MSTAIHPIRFAADYVGASPWTFVRGALRAVCLLAVSVFAVVDAGVVRLVTEPTGSRLAHARAAWLHRWSRIARRVLGLRLDRRGFTPVSGIVVANHTSLLDAILLAAVRPCVFVAGTEVRRWPIVGILARLGGTYFIDRQCRNDIGRINFMVQRAVQRRLLVVVFPECGSSDGDILRAFSPALFQPAVELGCTITAAAIEYPTEIERDRAAPLLAQLLTRCPARAVVAFGAPRFRRGDRKQLARQLRGEVLDLKLRVAQAA